MLSESTHAICFFLNQLLPGGQFEYEFLLPLASSF